MAATVIEGSITEQEPPGVGVLGSGLSQRQGVDRLDLLPRHTQRAADLAEARGGLGQEALALVPGQDVAE